jgi:hypothetical protein
MDFYLKTISRSWVLGGNTDRHLGSLKWLTVEGKRSREEIIL